MQEGNEAPSACLKTLMPVEARLGDGGQRARRQERKRTSEAALQAGRQETPTPWLDEMRSARATVIHVEPPARLRNEDGFCGICAKVTIGDRMAHLRIRADPSHETGLWDFITAGAKVTIFQPEITHVEHARQIDTVLTVDTQSGSTVLQHNADQGAFRREFNKIDVFCGAGGFTAGMREMDAKVVAAVKSRTSTAEVYKQNWPEVQVHIDDAMGPVVWTRMSRARPNVAICSTPCVSFSGAGDQAGLASKE